MGTSFSEFCGYIAKSPLHWADWLIIVGFLFVTLGMGLYFTRRASKDVESFFISGRSLPWFLSGISMVATSFASDTPLWVTTLVRKYGVHYCWQYWATGIGFTLTIALFARLWHRMRIMTDIEFIEIRYSGKTASVIRGWSVVTVLLISCPLTVGWVTKAVSTLMTEVTGLPPEYRIYLVIIAMVVAVLSCAFSGLWGVVYTDLIQFFLAFIGTTSLAFIAVHEVGGFHAMVDQLKGLTDWYGHDLRMMPKIGLESEGGMSIWNIIGYFGLLWIGVAISGGYMAQRMMACKNTRHASYAQILQSLLYTAVVAWPWIIVALCSLILIPNLGEGIPDDNAYPRMIVTYLPIGLRGMLVMSLLAAFMSTISTLFNWGSSYVVNDFYKRFIVRDAAPRHYVFVGRIATVGIAITGGAVSFVGEDVQELFTFAMVLGSGSALVAFLRWFWPRLNSRADFTAGVVALLLPFPMLLKVDWWIFHWNPVLDEPIKKIFGTEMIFSEDINLLGARMLVSMTIVTLTAVIVAFLTKPTDPDHLREFIRRARPFKFFWGGTAKRLGLEYEEGESIGRTMGTWGCALVMMFSLVLGIGKLVFCEYILGIALIISFVVFLIITIKRTNNDLKDLEGLDAAALEYTGALVAEEAEEADSVLK